MRLTSTASLVCGAFLLVACTSDVLLGDGDAGAAGGAAGQAGQAGQAGSGGQNDAGSCPSGHADCNKVSSDSCEVNLLSDSKNCGSCGLKCAAGATCQSGTCVGGAPCSTDQDCPANWACVNAQCVPAQDGGSPCTPGKADCDADPANGCEINLMADANNCGGCGVMCAAGQSCGGGVCSTTPQDGGSPCGNNQECPAGQVCVSGVCQVQQDSGPCGNGWADCDGDSSNGCETNVASDPLNCGMCASVCAGGQVCSSGLCTTDQDAGDAPYCSTNQECPPGQVCLSNECVSEDGGACPSGWADCDGVSYNGCEVYLLGDANNCGACGAACGTGSTCEAGTCVTATDAGPGTCDPFTSTPCQNGWACVVGIPYYSPSDIYCRPAGSTPADSACSPQALCIQGTTCVFEDPYGNGHCRKFCDLSGTPHGCPSGEHCAMIYHPTIGICVP